MGVYHLMGLGRSAGAITGPLSYLAHRFTRWEPDDQSFFARSGEAVQREQGQKVGDVQSIVLFTTPEVLKGHDSATNRPFHAFSYIDNLAGKEHGQEYGREKSVPMKEVLRSLLKMEWRKISGGRKEGSIFWVEIDRRDISLTYERIIKVVTALAGVGGQGKEIWANLTGGNNVINFALQLATTLSGDVARLYYVQAADQNTEKCIRFPSEQGYWVELPALPLDLNPLSLEIIRLVEQRKANTLQEFYSQLSGDYWKLLQNIAEENFREIYLKPLWKQGIIAEKENQYVIGSQWELIGPYTEILQHVRSNRESLEELSKNHSWIESEAIDLG